MVNGYYDFHNSTAFTPYISAGIGLARVKLKNNTMSEDFDINETLAASKITLPGARVSVQNML